jgi:hypothetical protein
MPVWLTPKIHCGMVAQSRVPGTLACLLACLLVYHIFHDFGGRPTWPIHENKILSREVEIELQCSSLNTDSFRRNLRNLGPSVGGTAASAAQQKHNLLARRPWPRT